MIFALLLLLLKESLMSCFLTLGFLLTGKEQGDKSPEALLHLCMEQVLLLPLLLLPLPAQVSHLFSSRLSGQDLRRLQDTIEEIGWRAEDEVRQAPASTTSAPSSPTYTSAPDAGRRGVLQLLPAVLLFPFPTIYFLILLLLYELLLLTPALCSNSCSLLLPPAGLRRGRL